MANIQYKTSEIKDFYSQNRVKWDDFYASERCIIEKCVRKDNGTLGSVFDAGCAVGGLGMALSQKKYLTSYTGMDINSLSIEHANSIKWAGNIRPEFIHGDILKSDCLSNKKFDTVISLSCADWNIEVWENIEKLWSYVRPGGKLIISLRLTPEETTLDYEESYQIIKFNDQELQDADEERAPYVVINILEALQRITALDKNVAEVIANGYWGSPSSTAVTRYNKIVFAVFSVYRSTEDDVSGRTIHFDMNLPAFK